MKSTKAILTMTDKELEEVAKGYHKLWSGQKTVAPNTLTNTLQGFRAEMIVARKLEKIGCTEIVMDGFNEFLTMAETQRKVHSDKPDITCNWGGIPMLYEVKSGDASRYQWIQFRVKDVAKWTRHAVTFVAWVEYRKDGSYKLWRFSMDDLADLPVMKNAFGEACYTKRDNEGKVYNDG